MEDHVRHRGGGGGGLGRSSGGAFDGGAISTHSQGGSARPFDPSVSSLQTRREQTSRYDSQQSDSYWSRSYSSYGRSWRGGGGGGSQGQQQVAESGIDFYWFIGFFVIVVSLWMLISLYGSQVLEMGLFYSRVLKASPLLVKEIKVQNLGEPGPVVTSFAKHPAYGHPFISDEKFNVTVNPRFHQRYGFWLNKGSSFTLVYNVKDSWEDSLVLAIVRGEDSYQEWTKDPSNAQLVSAWKRIYGRGSLNFTVTEDDDYYVAFGNLNAHEMKISFHLKMHCMIYSVQDAESRCSLVNGNVCRVPLSLSKSKRVLISAPDKKQHGVDVWKVKVSYIPRWITYFILWSVIGLGLLGMELRKQGRQVSTSQREVVPLTSIEGNGSPENLARESQSADFSPALGSENFQGGRGEQSLEQLCTVCLDAPKDSFFDPCGHRCTCYACGMRIQNGDIARCPICRENVRAVRRIYDS